MHYVFVDMNTQRDFLETQGAYPITNRDTLIPYLRKVFALARAYHVPVISSLDSHREVERPNGLPKHCVEGTFGQQKLRYTLLPSRILVEANNTLDLPDNLLNCFRQVILRRRTHDFLDNPKADRLFSGLSKRHFVLFGVGLERSIRRLVLALMARGNPVCFLPEACGYWNEIDADLTQRLLIAKGSQAWSIDQLESMLKNATQKRIKRIFSKPPTRSKSRRSMAG